MAGIMPAVRAGGKLIGVLINGIAANSMPYAFFPWQRTVAADVSPLKHCFHKRINRPCDATVNHRA
jgi:hypothetical protein